jgi:hypothetical protein
MRNATAAISPQVKYIQRDKKITDEISKRLKEIYANVPNEPLPKQLQELLARLDADGFNGE